MRFSGKVNNRVNLFFAKEPADKRVVADISAHKTMGDMQIDFLEILQVTRVRELVQTHKAVSRVSAAPKAHEIGADEPSTASDKNPAHVFVSCRCGSEESCDGSCLINNKSSRFCHPSGGAAIEVKQLTRQEK